MKSFVRLLAMALALATTSHTFEPVRDQYSLAEATDHPQKRPSAMPDLQVGCADGTINDGISDKKSKRRRKRAYVPWSGQIAYPQPYQRISVYKPPVYALQRPYYVPIYGVKGRPPIYFPPQPLYANPGTPPDNPQRFQGPQYLPPREPPTTTMPVGNRFGEGDNGQFSNGQFDDGRPIWTLDEQTTRRPSGSVPTRAPRPPGANTPPPLVHGPPSSGGGEIVPPPQQVYPTRRPAAATTRRPYPTRRPQTTTTRRPNSEPTRCVWAIISCCSTTGEISYDCFEERGCPGAFWDNSPCDSEFAKAAIAAALNYYN